MISPEQIAFQIVVNKQAGHYRYNRHRNLAKAVFEIEPLVLRCGSKKALTIILAVKHALFPFRHITFGTIKRAA